MTATMERPSTTQTPPPAGDMSLGHAAHRIYALFHNKRFGLLLILAMCVLTVFGVAFPQGGEAARDPEAWAQFIKQVRTTHGGWADVLGAIGFLNMFSSVAFRTVTTLLALSIIACTTHRIPNLWKAAVHPHIHVREGFHERARLHGTAHVAAEPQEAYDSTVALLQRRGFRVIQDPDAPWSAYTDRHRWAPFGTVLAHAAFVVILIGAVITGAWGFRDDNFIAPVGQPVEVGHGTGLTLTAHQFTDTYNEAGRPTDYYADITLTKAGQQVAQQRVRVNAPLSHDGIKFHQAAFGVAADVTVSNRAAGEFSASVPLQYSSPDEQNTYGIVHWPAANLDIYVMGAASGAQGSMLRPGQMLVEFYQPGANKPVASQIVDQGRTVVAGEQTITFSRERQYTSLMVNRDPGAIWVWIGSAMIMIGMSVTMFLRHHRIWLRVDADEAGSRVRLASPDRHDQAFENRFGRLLSQIESTPGSAPASHS